MSASPQGQMVDTVDTPPKKRMSKRRRYAKPVLLIVLVLLLLAAVLGLGITCATGGGAGNGDGNNGTTAGNDEENENDASGNDDAPEPIDVDRRDPVDYFLIRFDTKALDHGVISGRLLLPDQELPEDERTVSLEGDDGDWRPFRIALVEELRRRLESYPEAHTILLERPVDDRGRDLLSQDSRDELIEELEILSQESDHFANIDRVDWVNPGER